MSHHTEEQRAEALAWCGEGCVCPDTTVTADGDVYPIIYSDEWHLEYRSELGGCVCVVYDWEAEEGLGGEEVSSGPSRWVEGGREDYVSVFGVGITTVDYWEYSTYTTGETWGVSDDKIEFPTEVNFEALVWYVEPDGCTNVYADKPPHSSTSRLLDTFISTAEGEPIAYEMYGYVDSYTTGTWDGWVTGWSPEIDLIDDIDFENVTEGQVNIFFEYIYDDQSFWQDISDVGAPAWYIYHATFDHLEPAFTNAVWGDVAETMYQLNAQLGPTEETALKAIYGDVGGIGTDSLKTLTALWGEQVALMSGQSARTFKKIRPTLLDDDVFDIFGDEQTEPTQSLTVSITGTY